MNFSMNDIMIQSEFTLNMLETELKILLKEYEVENKHNLVDHMKSRIKSRESIIAKLEKRGYEITYENIEKHVHDKVGIRIICPFLSDVKEVVKVIKASEQFIIKEEKDYIAAPKESGYISYHLIILLPVYFSGRTEYREAEIQIRTMAMDFWASLDHMIRYKFDEDKIPNEVKDGMYECSVAIKSLDEKMLNFKTKSNNCNGIGGNDGEENSINNRS